MRWSTVCYICNLGITCTSYVNLLEHGPSNIGLKATIKEYKMQNQSTTWAGTADRGETITFQRSADSSTTLFTYNKRSEMRCWLTELHFECEKNYNKIVGIESSVFSVKLPVILNNNDQHKRPNNGSNTKILLQIASPFVVKESCTDRTG